MNPTDEPDPETPSPESGDYDRESSEHLRLEIDILSSELDAQPDGTAADGAEAELADSPDEAGADAES